MQDTTQTIKRAATKFLSGTMLSRVTGLLRDMAMAFAFGASGSVAAFMMAFRFAHLLRRLLGEGPMQSAFIPYYEALKHENPQRAVRFFRDLLASVSGLLVVIIVLTIGVLGAWWHWGNISRDNGEVIFLTILLLPSLLFICLYGLNTAFLQCERSYFIPSFAPVVCNVIWILGVLWLRPVSAATAMPYLAVIVVVGCIAEWLFTVPKTRLLQAATPRERLCFFPADVRGLMKPLSLGIIGVAASQVNNAMDTVFARYADASGPAYLWFAIRIQQLPLALFGIALSGALLPPLSRAMKRGDINQFLSFFSYALCQAITMMLPITVGMLLFGGEIINVVYGRGDFQIVAITQTTYCLWGYVFGLIPMTLTLVLAPALYARHKYRATTIASVVSMGLNVLLNAVAIFGLGWGAASVAVATSLAAWVNCALLAYSVAKEVNGAFKTKEIFKQTGWVTAATAIASVAALMTASSPSVWTLCSGGSCAFPQELISQVKTLVLPTLLFGGAFLVTARSKKG